MKNVLLITATFLLAPAPAWAFFGLDGKATEATQMMNNTELALQTAEQIKQTEMQLRNLMNLPGFPASGVVADVKAMLAELARMKESFATIYDDPANSGEYEASLAYRKLQSERQLGRLEQMAKTSALIEQKVASSSAAADELAAENQGAVGNLDTQKAGNEIALLGADLQRQQILLDQENFRAAAQKEAREEEDRQLAKAQDCVFWTTQFYTPEECK